MKYRKKPIIIEAFQWGIDEVPEWWKEKSNNFEVIIKTGSVIISTLEGNHEAKVGNYIIKGIKGELYSCREDIFKETYEEVLKH